MSLKKQFLKSSDVCKVTFRLSKADTNNAEKVNLAGSFNGWNTQSELMSSLKSGDFTLTLSLPVNQEYEFRYLLNDTQWINDPEADAYAQNGLGEENSILKTSV
ncbi:MAG: isoamylase early set domain-containing protein [Prolixibacteraceae bacterium]|nr:isoamylase early set domain-containing protein [Prolixibacteraceae bacterium]